MKQAHSWRSSWACGYGAGPRPAVQGLSHNREGEVKTRLTIGNFGHFWPGSGKKSPKKVRPRPFRTGASTEGTVPGSAPTACSHGVGAFPVRRDIEAFAFGFRRNEHYDHALAH